MSELVLDPGMTSIGSWSDAEAAALVPLQNGSTMVRTYRIRHSTPARHVPARPYGDSADYVVIAVDELVPGEPDPGIKRIDVFEAHGSATLYEATALEVYLRVDRRDLRDRLHDLVVRAAPSVPQIVSIALSVPGIAAQERAMDLLSFSIGPTVVFARWLETIIDRLDPYYAYKAWNIVLGGLGYVPAGHPGARACAVILQRYLESDDPIQRQSAYDALETFTMMHGDAASLNA